MILACLLPAVAHLIMSQASPVPGYLVNAGFESAILHQGWSLNVYGAQPEVTLDSAIAKDGRRSLRVSTAAPSDTAFGQEIMLKPGRYYKLTGWVRTRGLDPHGAPVYGTFQIQQPGGSGVIASGENHGGDAEWTQVAIPFRAPPGGRTRIAIFFVGYGRGTGTAWFDDLRISEMTLDSAPITVTRRPLCPGEISPFQYGQFIEYLCDLVPGMWAEKLYDGSFEGLSPYRFVYLKETDFKEKPWYPSGATNRAVFAQDRITKISGEVSQRIAAEAGTPCTVGISQDGIAVQKGAACNFSLYLRQAGVRGEVVVRLHHEGKELASCRFRPGSDWRKFTSRLDPSDTETNATLTIEFRGPGTLWLDNASLMPEDNVGGWRRDVVEALRALKPGIIRFGGSALDDPNLGEFSWRDTLGDPDRRPPFRAWGGLQQAAAGLEEIVQLCQAVGAEPLICVRFTKSTPEEAAAQVLYFNGAVDTPMGRMRAANGHKEPYRIRYWQIGNELDNPAYIAGLPGFCRAMKQADPNIKLLSSFPSSEVVRAAGGLLDYLCPHQYGCEDLTGKAQEIGSIMGLAHELAPGRPIRIAVTEWNTTAGDAGPRRAMLWTLANALACSRYQNLLHRHCDAVEIANRSNLTNSFCSGIIQTDNHRLYETPTYYAQQLYATLGGNQPLAIESAVPAEMAPDVSATLSKDGRIVTLFAVNDSMEPISRALDLSAFGGAAQGAEVWTLTDRKHAGEPDVTNGFDDPERVAPVHSTLHAAAARFKYVFPALSLTVIRWKVNDR